MTRLRTVIVGLFGLVTAGCDDGTVISRVIRHSAASQYLALSGPDGLPTEVHGAPFPGVDPEWVARHLKPPPALPTGIRFRAIGIGTTEGPRLLLVFNRRDVPDAIRDCRRTTEAPVDPPTPVGFSVTASLCNDGSLVASAHMTASKTRGDDPAEFARVMRLLLMELTDRPA